MIGTDVLLVVLLSIVVVIIININIINAKKIRKNQEKANTSKSESETAKTDKPTAKPTDNSNFMHDYFNPNEIEIQEVSSEQINNPRTATGTIEKYRVPLPESEDDFNTKADIINSLNRNDTMPDQEEYDIGIRDDEEKDFSSAITQEFKSLSPAMKAFIMANVTKSSVNKSGFAPAQDNDVVQTEIVVKKPKDKK